MQIRAMYIRTTQRDRYDGRAQFEIIPQGDCNLHTPGRHNALECVGNIQPYLPGMPVLLEGDFDGCKLHVRNDWFDVRTRSGIDTINADNIHSFIAADYDPTKSQIISPIKGGMMGTFALNRMIQSRINGNSPVVAVYGKREFRLNDKVIMTKNNYDAHYINGDIGYIERAFENGNLLVEFAGGTICISRDDYCNMDLAYAITIHKSQGSEFPIVHIVLSKDGRMMRTRRLLYTAITRAKQKVIIYNQGSSLRDAIADRAEKPRVTMLQNRLRKCMDKR